MAHLQPEAAGQLREKQEAASGVLKERIAKIGYVDLAASREQARILLSKPFRYEWHERSC